MDNLGCLTDSLLNCDALHYTRGLRARCVCTEADITSTVLTRLLFIKQLVSELTVKGIHTLGLSIQGRKSSVDFISEEWSQG